jgi:hypothetical protein
MSLDEGDQLAAVVRVPREEKADLGPNGPADDGSQSDADDTDKP